MAALGQRNTTHLSQPQNSSKDYYHLFLLVWNSELYQS